MVETWQSFPDRRLCDAEGARRGGVRLDEDAESYLGFVLNWYLNRTLKLQFNYDRTRFEGGGAGGRDLPTERILFSRFQAAF